MATPVAPAMPQPQQAPMQQPAANPMMQAEPASASASTVTPTPISSAPGGKSGAEQSGTAAPVSRHDNPNTTQGSLLISEARDSVVIMKDGSFRAVVACKSINFSLMSENERAGVEMAYKNFLDSLYFTTQILIRSQRIDIAPYLDRLIDQRRHTDNMLLGRLMDNYIAFIDELSQEANIMDKSFFIAIPYYTSSEAEKAVMETKNFFKSFSRGHTTVQTTRIDRATYDKAIDEINSRVDRVISGLYEMGVQAVRLNTNQLGQLYYNCYNPGESIHQPIGDINNLNHLYTKKAEPGEDY